MRAHFRLNRAKKLGLIAVMRRVNEDLRPARVVCQNAPYLRYNPICDLHNDRASSSAFPDAAALEIAGIDDPWIARDDFEGVDVAKRPIIVAARGEIRSRARRIVLVARAPASGMQDADIEPPGYRLRIADSIILDHLPVRKATAVQRDAQILDAVGLGPLRRKLKNALRPSQGLGDQAFSVMIALQEECWNAAI